MTTLPHPEIEPSDAVKRLIVRWRRRPIQNRRPTCPCGFAGRPNTIGPHQKQCAVWAAYQRMAHWTTVPEV